MLKRTSIVALFIVFCSSTFAQQITVRSHFMADSLKIGERVPVAVTARYPSSLSILFPDSTYAFTPFEYEGKNYFPTVTTDSLSYDSVVYYLASYEIDSMQTLALPIYMINESDCTAVYGARDTIFLKHLVEVVPDSIEAQLLPLKTNTNYFNVHWLFNYPMYIGVGIFLFGTLLACYFIFEKHVRKYFLVRKLKRYHNNFMTRFSGAVSGLEQQFSGKQAEAAVLTWKQYMEKLDNKPYTMYTTREITRMEHNEKLEHALKVIDRGIYGGYGQDVFNMLNELRAYSEAHYSQKLQEVQNG